MAHMKLAQRSLALGTVRHAVHHAAAHAANAFAAIVIERHRLFTLGQQILVQYVEHFQKRHVLADVGRFVPRHAALVAGVLLPPHVEDDSHL